jgi:hypothetical protein
VDPAPNVSHAQLRQAKPPPIPPSFINLAIYINENLAHSMQQTEEHHEE